MTSCDFILFYSFLTQANIIFLDVLGKAYYVGNLCPTMIHFNALDFNVCCTEEVMFLLMLSVHSGTWHRKNLKKKSQYSIILVHVQIIFIDSLLTVDRSVNSLNVHVGVAIDGYFLLLLNL